MRRQSRIWCGMPFRRLLCSGRNDFRCITHENEIFGKMSYNNACPYDDFANFAPQKKKTGNMPEEIFIYDTDCTDEPLFDRGFTGHEHLYAFGLINMNGRVYDPLMSSFLSPDNYVQDPTSQQGFNRYAYCFYNPLKYVDPTGERAFGPRGIQHMITIATESQNVIIILLTNTGAWYMRKQTIRMMFYTMQTKGKISELTKGKFYPCIMTG